MSSALQEADILHTLQHPFIVGYKEAVPAKDNIFLIMEYCERGDLAQWIKARSDILVHELKAFKSADTTGTSAADVANAAAAAEVATAMLTNAPSPIGIRLRPANGFASTDEVYTYCLLPEDVILEWFTELALAVHHIHKRKILHRDLKTQNIFVTMTGQRQGDPSNPETKSASAASSSLSSTSSWSDEERLVVKIGDFGISKVMHSETSMCQTVIGTPYYLSPEICEGRTYGSRSDVWSLGCILYEMSTLRHAFDGRTLPALVLKILRGSYPPLHASYSKELAALVASMLQQDPKQVWQQSTVLTCFSRVFSCSLLDRISSLYFSHSVCSPYCALSLSHSSAPSTAPVNASNP